MRVNYLGNGVENCNSQNNIIVINGAIDLVQKDIDGILDTGFPSAEAMTGDIQMNSMASNYTKVHCSQTSVYCKPTSSFPNSCAC